MALISTMYYFAISQHRYIQIPARSWMWHHPPPTPPPEPDSTETIPPPMKPPISWGQSEALDFACELVSRLGIAGCRKLMPARAQTAKGVIGAHDPLADLNCSCHSTGRNWCKLFLMCFSFLWSWLLQAYYSCSLMQY